MRTQLETLTQTVNQTRDMLGRVETHLENHNEHKEGCEANHNEHEEECDWLVLYQRRDEQYPHSQYLKNIKIDVHTFDERHNPQLS